MVTTTLRMRQMFTRNFPDVSYISDYTHDTWVHYSVPCYAYRAPCVKEVFSSAFFVTAMTAKVLSVFHPDILAREGKVEFRECEGGKVEFWECEGSTSALIQL